MSNSFTNWRIERLVKTLARARREADLLVVQMNGTLCNDYTEVYLDSLARKLEAARESVTKISLRLDRLTSTPTYSVD